MVSPPHLIQRAGSVACRRDQKNMRLNVFVIPALRAGNRVVAVNLKGEYRGLQ